MGVFSLLLPYNGGWPGWPLPLVALDGLLHFLLDWCSPQTLTSKFKLEELLVSYTQLGRIKARLYATELGQGTLGKTVEIPHFNPTWLA